ncbi:MAG: P1 family peptidase [Acidobacteriaceae bacterium]|nr:P1 family peptidase [Acidobacteriaceae bacterium]
MRACLAGIVAGTIAAATTAAVSAQTANLTLTAVNGIKVGHYTLTERPTGCTAVLVEAGAVAGVDVRGAAPATAETDLLKPVNLVQQINAVVLSGGSAFGLDSRSGVMRYLDEKHIGFKAFGNINVPIVSAASLFDLNVGGNANIRPTADCGYNAAAAASTQPVAEGNVGAGAGATVGKLGGFDHAMKGGLGTSAIRMPNGLIVAALVAVNAVGDIIDPATGKVVAGTRGDSGTTLADARTLLLRGALRPATPGTNTTLGIIATNATLTKTEATRVAEMAHDGYARAIVPSHTMNDGDAIFAIATGERKETVDVSQVGSLAATAIADAVLRAVRQATSIPGYPAARDLTR